MTVLVTGAGGYVGRALCARLSSMAGLALRGTSHRNATQSVPGVHMVHVGALQADTQWDAALEGVTAVVHLAARVHVLRERAADPDAAFQVANASATRALATAAARAGVARFVFLSSIGAVASIAHGTVPEDAPPTPAAPYGRSKLAAERALHDVHEATGMPVAVLRPPMIYGPGAPGNFGQLVRAVAAGIPLPLGSVRNRRSFMFIGNVADALVHLVTDAHARHATYNVADLEALSTPQLVREIAAGLGRPARLFPVPVPVLRGLGRLSGRSDTVSRLVDSLEVDSSRIQRELPWTPPFPVREGIRQSVEAL